MKNAFRMILACMVAVMAISCASTPKPGPGATDSLSVARKAAEDSKAKALDVKANVASKALFDQADAALTEAGKLEAVPDATNAAAKYGEATDLFKKAYDDASAKKEAAQKSLDTAAGERKTAEEAFEAAARERQAAEKGE